MKRLVRIDGRDVDPADFRRGFGVTGLLIQAFFALLIWVSATLERLLLRVIAKEEGKPVDVLIEEIKAERTPVRRTTFQRSSASTLANTAQDTPKHDRASRYKEAKAGEAPAQFSLSPAFMRTLAAAGLTRDSRYVAGRRASMYVTDDSERDDDNDDVD